jgi:hypothetical protein
MLMMDAYAYYSDDLSPQGRGAIFRHPAKGYLKFWITEKLWEMIEGYAANPPENLEYSHYTREHLQEIRDNRDELMAVFERNLAETEERLRKMNEKRDAESAALLENHQREREERMKNDPIFRFAENLVRYIPEDEQKDEGSQDK